MRKISKKTHDKERPRAPHKKRRDVPDMSYMYTNIFVDRKLGYLYMRIRVEPQPDQHEMDYRYDIYSCLLCELDNPDGWKLLGRLNPKAFMFYERRERNVFGWVRQGLRAKLVETFSKVMMTCGQNNEPFAFVSEEEFDYVNNFYTDPTPKEQRWVHVRSDDKKHTTPLVREDMSGKRRPMLREKTIKQIFVMMETKRCVGFEFDSETPKVEPMAITKEGRRLYYSEFVHLHPVEITSINDPDIVGNPNYVIPEKEEKNKDDDQDKEIMAAAAAAVAAQKNDDDDDDDIDDVIDVDLDEVIVQHTKPTQPSQKDIVPFMANPTFKDYIAKIQDIHFNQCLEITNLTAALGNALEEKDRMQARIDFLENSQNAETTGKPVESEYDRTLRLIDEKQAATIAEFERMRQEVIARKGNGKMER